MYHTQHGNGRCSLCGSPGTNKSSCPLNPIAKSHNYEKHPNARVIEQPKQIKNISKEPKLIKNQVNVNKEIIPIQNITDDKLKLKLKGKGKPLISSSIEPLKPKCKNEYTLMGDEVDSIPFEKLYVSPDGNCFNISDDLFNHLKNGNNTDPYTNRPLWTNSKEMDKFLNHKGFTVSERNELTLLFKEPLKPNIIRILSTLPEFEMIYKTGYACFIDYTYNFEIAERNLKELANRLNLIGNDGQEILNLREMSLGNPETLREILDGAGLRCIHGVGSKLISFYLNLWHTLPVDKRPALPNTVLDDMSPDLSPNVNNYAKLVVFNTTSNNFYVMLYIYDWENRGQRSYYSYFLILKRGAPILEENIPKNAGQKMVFDLILDKYYYNKSMDDKIWEVAGIAKDLTRSLVFK